MDIMERIKQQIESDKVVLYMKGTPQFPQCGFSSQVVQALHHCDTKYSFINILEDPEVRENLRRYANWPTFPQLYVNGELIGGCDIIMDMYQRGELQSLLTASETASE